MKSDLKRKDVLGFTLIEIIVVIVVMSILSTITIVSYSSWQKSSYTNSVRSDLVNAGAAMENARNYSTGYPGSLTGIYKASAGIVLTLASSDAKSYCIDASSSKDATVLYYVDSNHAKNEPQPGTCAGRAGVVGAPTGLAAATASTSSITVTWTPVSGATGYNLQRSSSASFADAVDITSVISPYVSTGLLESKTYYYRIKAFNASSSSAWSSVANAPTSSPSIATPSAPVVTANTVTSTTTYTWPNVSCAVNQKVRYKYQYTISPAGYSSGWVSYGTSLSAAFTSTNEGQYYSLAVQAQCYTADGFSAWSTSGTTRYYRPGTWVAIGVMCGIASDLKAYCWGTNYYGSVGNGTTGNGGTTAAVYSPVAVDTTGPLSGKTINAISGDYAKNCAIASDNFVYCWGRNNKGQIGDNTIVDKSVPTTVIRTGALSGKTIKKVAGDSLNGSCVIASDNYAYCWGDNLIVGDGTGAGQKLVPTAVLRTGALNGLTVKEIDTGYYDSCVIASNNLPYCWGMNQDGNAGNGTASGNNYAPVAVTVSGALSGKTVKKISVGYSHACVIASDNKPYCWGDNTSGQIGDNTSGTDRLVPTAVVMTGALNGLTVKEISAGFRYTCVIASDNKAYCWGLNDYGQAKGPTTANLLVPTAVDNSPYYSGVGLNTISARQQLTYGTTYALGTNGVGYVWGAGGSGSYGDGGSFTYYEVRPICNPFWKTTCYGVEP